MSNHRCQVHTFKDKSGKEWQVEITVATNKDVKRVLKYSLYDLIDNHAKPLEELLNDPERIVALLYVICTEQAESLSIAPEDFGKMFTGDVLEEATDALVAETICFFPNRRARESLRKIIDKAKQLGTMLLERADRTTAEINLEREADELVKKLKSISGSSPASSELTPTLEPTAS